MEMMVHISFWLGLLVDGGNNCGLGSVGVWDSIFSKKHICDIDIGSLTSRKHTFRSLRS